MSGRWTAAEVALLRALYPDHRTAWVAAKLGRPLGGVRSKAKQLGLRTLGSQRPLSLRAEIEAAKAEWGTAPPYEGWRTR